MIFILFLIKILMNHSSSDMSSLSDATLLERCNFYGTQARRWRNKFLGLLPEIARRELYKEKGFGSIFEFAFRIGGVSKEQVERVLRVERQLQDVPALHGILVRGEVSVNKIARITSIATVENDQELAERVKILPRQALETFVRDVRHELLQTDKVVHVQKAALESNPITSQVIAAPPDASLLELNRETIGQLMILKEKGFDLNELLPELLRKREEKIQELKDRIAQDQEEKELSQVETNKLHSSYIPQKIKKVLKAEFGTKCAIPTCRNMSQEIHHTARQSLSRSHNPFFLAPLCKEHHILAHHVDLKYQEKRRR